MEGGDAQVAEGELDPGGDLGEDKRKAYNAAVQTLTELQRRGRFRTADMVDYLFLGQGALNKRMNDQRVAPFVAAEQVPGVKGNVWKLRNDVGYTVAFSLGRRNLRGAVFNANHELVGGVALEPLRESGDGWKAEEFYDLVVDLTRQVISDAGIGAEKIVGLTVAIPAPVARSRRPDAEKSTELASHWTLRPLAGELPVRALRMKFKALDGPQDSALRRQLGSENPLRISLVNDATAAAFGTVMWLKTHKTLAPPANLLYVFVGDGVGAGAIVGHRPLYGGAGLAGEIGHIAVDPQGEFCPRCGKRGCLEVVASGSMMARRIASGLDAKPTDPEPFFEFVQSASPRGRAHPLVSSVLREAGWHLGTRLGAICNVLNPNVVVVDSYDLVELAARWNPEWPDELPGSFSPTHSPDFRNAVLRGLDQHAISPIRRWLEPPRDGVAEERRGAPADDLFTAKPTLGRGVHFGTDTLGIELKEKTTLPLVGAASVAMDDFFKEYLKDQLGLFEPGSDEDSVAEAAPNGA